MLHEQFLEFMEKIPFKIDYGNKKYIDALDMYKMIHLFDVELAVKMAVQFNLWGETLYRLGTEKHNNYIRKTETIEILGCFAMTEIGHGSNVMKLETTAHYNIKRKEFIIHSPTYTSHKFWIGQGSMFAHYAIVFAQLYINNECKGVHPFIVQLRNIKTKELLGGIHIYDCGKKNGLNAIDNAEIWFDRISIPYDNLLDKFASIDENGAYKTEKGRFGKMLNELTKNRFGLGEGCNIIAKFYLKNALQYSLIRKQFGMTEEIKLLNYPSHRKRLFILLSKTIMYDIYCNEMREYIENPQISHISSIISKVYGTKNCLNVLQECRESMGGHGYHATNNISKTYQNIDIYTTFEGDNTVLLQQLFQYEMKQIKKEMTMGNFVMYKLQKYTNFVIGLASPIIHKSINLEVMHINLSATIRYMTINILLQLRDSHNKFETWRINLNKIIQISELIMARSIIETYKIKNDNLILPLIELFLFEHIKNNIPIYSTFIPIKHIKNIDNYEEKLYNMIYSKIDYYIYSLKIPELNYFNRFAHIKKIMGKL